MLEEQRPFAEANAVQQLAALEAQVIALKGKAHLDRLYAEAKPQGTIARIAVIAADALNQLHP